MSSYRKIKKKSELFNPFPESVRQIAIVSPGSAPDKKLITDFCRNIAGLGIKTYLPENVFSPSLSRKIPVEPEKRAADFNRCLKKKGIDLIIASRGGFGSAHILEKINWELLKEKKIPVLGYSDLTALHLAMIRKNAGIPVSSPMADKFFSATRYPLTANSLRIALQPDMKRRMIYNSPNIEVIRKKSAKGAIMPVNLTVFTSMIGSKFMPSTKGFILLVEDIAEQEYKIERMLTQLEMAGILRKCSGLLFGKFTSCGSKSVLAGIFAKFAKYVSGPVLAGIDFGHVRKRLCFRYGRNIEITPDGRIIV